MERLILDVPTIYVGDITNPTDLASLTGKELGMTSDGLKLGFTPNIREIDFDGRNGRKIKDMERILAWDCSAETKGLELSDNALKFSLIEKDDSYTTSADYDRFVPSRNITYQDIIIVGKVHGSNKPAVVVMKNCYNPEGVILETKDSDEGKFTFKAEARYEYDPLKDAQGTDSIPCEIYLPKVAVTP